VRLVKVVKINAIWCSACIIMNKVWDNILKKYDIETASLDYDFDSVEVSKYDVGDVLPVFIFINNDEEIFRVVGEKTEKEMFEIIEKLGGINEKDN